MRLFTAIDLDNELRLKLDRLIHSVRADAMVKWTPVDNMHVTTKFIGDWPSERLQELKPVLARLQSHQPFEMEVRKLGWFPERGSPRVFWVGINDESGALRKLAMETEEAASSLGIAKENRDFTPHLTLARVTQRVPLNKLRERWEEMRDISVGRLLVREFHLYESRPGSNWSQYSKLETFPFQPAAAAAGTQS